MQKNLNGDFLQGVSLVDPATGAGRPYPSHAAQWRIYHGQTAWLFIPWSGDRRDARDVGSDCFGYAIAPTDGPLKAA